MKTLPDLTNEQAWATIYEGAKEIERLRLIERDARELATGVQDPVGCLASEEMRAVAARIIQNSEGSRTLREWANGFKALMVDPIPEPK